MSDLARKLVQLQVDPAPWTCNVSCCVASAFLPLPGSCGRHRLHIQVHFMHIFCGILHDPTQEAIVIRRSWVYGTVTRVAMVSHMVPVSKRTHRGGMLQMEKQHLEQRLQQARMQPPSQSGSPATSQQDSAARTEKAKSPDRTQVQCWSAAQLCTLFRVGNPHGSIRACAVSKTSSAS